MKKAIDIVVIGGGSSYTPELIEGFIKRYTEVPVKSIRLVDIEEGRDKLHIIAALAERMVAKAGVPITISATLDRKTALRGADFVCTQFRAGLMEARILDERIPASHGMLGQETNGAGGLFKALRTIPVILDIIDDMKVCCPSAWLINFTNPAGVVSEAVFRLTDWHRYIGLCNVPIHQLHHFSEVLKVKPKELVSEVAGLNHMSYVLHLYHQNKNCLPAVIDKIGAKQQTMANIDPLAFSPTFIRQLGAYPNPYHKYYYFQEEMLASNLEQCRQGKTRAEVVKTIEEALFKQYADPALAVKPKELEQRGGAYYSDVACNIITSIVRDKRDYQVVNTMNQGHITDLPDGCAVEITARITKDGPMPVHIGRLPVAIRGLVQHMKAYEELVVDAVEERDLDKALLALKIHPLTTSVTVAEKVFDELVEAHRRHLGYYEEATS
ncbi:MAG: 6-phospho-beta-glucosidase [Acholeplasmataceae bacterium]|nr:MAG: 6-phospho-beta-glucosidase [Acholeplasmataceae bacterium]